MTDDQPSIARPTGCRCHIEAGDSVCPVHPPDPDELAYAASIGAPYLDVDHRPSIAELQRAHECVVEGCWTDAQDRLLAAAPVLLEIAAAALASRLPITSEQGARDRYTALMALDVALAKVRQ